MSDFEFQGPPCPEDVPFRCAWAASIMAEDCGGCSGCDKMPYKEPSTGHRCHKTGRLKHCQQLDCDLINQAEECPGQWARMGACGTEWGADEDDRVWDLNPEAAAAWDATLLSCPGRSADLCAPTRDGS